MLSTAMVEVDVVVKRLSIAIAHSSTPNWQMGV
jgi:hypothetical protein